MSSAPPKASGSELTDPRQRFLSRVVEHTLSDHWRSAEDFLRHFPPSAIIDSLAHADALRVQLLVAATGTHEKIALKKSLRSATEDLELALAEQTTTPGNLVGLYPPDDKVRHFEAKKLWAFVIEDEFYKATRNEISRHARAAGRMVFLIETALAEKLITLRDVVDGLTIELITASLPEADVRAVFRHALEIARDGNPLSEERFLAVVPLRSLISYVSLEHIYQRVLVERVARPAGFMDAEAAAPPPAIAEPAAPPPPPPPPPSEPDVEALLAEMPPPVPPAPPSPTPSMTSIADVERPPEEDEVRGRTIERLRALDRLPPSFLDLSTPVLLCLESMYADLWTINDDEEREACIRESFPNESHLRTGILALIELLDPSVDTKDPIIRDADIAGLIKIVLFEERRRREATNPPRRLPAGPPKNTRRTVPPPLPRGGSSDGRGSSPPPPLPAEAKRDR